MKFCFPGFRCSEKTLNLRIGLLVFFIISELDVAVGSLHADQNGRASLVYDLGVLATGCRSSHFSWVTLQRWRRSDFVIDRQGVVRVHPQLVRVIVTKALLPDGVSRAEINAYVSLLKQLGGKPLKPVIQQSFHV